MALGRKRLYFIIAFFFILDQFPSGCKAGLDYAQLFPGGELSVCEPCRLGRGKCRRMCLETEKIAGYCKENFLCCRERIL